MFDLIYYLVYSFLSIVSWFQSMHRKNFYLTKHEIYFTGSLADATNGRWMLNYDDAHPVGNNWGGVMWRKYKYTRQVESLATKFNTFDEKNESWRLMK